VRISLHGGNCCGIKHIHDLGYYPDGIVSARRSIKRTSYGQHSLPGHNDMMHSVELNPKGRYDFFNIAAPQESYEARFRRFVQFVENKRPHGIIEVVLNKMQKKWLPIVANLGFKEVSSGVNSNSHGTITIYHLVY
jgi:hypothetical protein